MQTERNKILNEQASIQVEMACDIRYFVVVAYSTAVSQVDINTIECRHLDVVNS